MLFRVSLWLMVLTCMLFRVSLWLMVLTCMLFRVSLWLIVLTCMLFRVSLWLMVLTCMLFRVSLWLMVFWCSKRDTWYWILCKKMHLVTNNNKTEGIPSPSLNESLTWSGKYFCVNKNTFKHFICYSYHWFPTIHVYIM